MKVYIVFSEVEEHTTHVLGVFLNKELADRALSIALKDDNVKAYIEDHELDTIYTTEEDKTLFKIAGFNTETDKRAKIADILVSIDKLEGEEEFFAKFGERVIVNK